MRANRQIGYEEASELSKARALRLRWGVLRERIAPRHGAVALYEGLACFELWYKARVAFDDSQRYYAEQPKLSASECRSIWDG